MTRRTIFSAGWLLIWVASSGCGDDPKSSQSAEAQGVGAGARPSDDPEPAAVSGGSDGTVRGEAGRALASGGAGASGAGTAEVRGGRGGAGAAAAADGGSNAADGGDTPAAAGAGAAAAGMAGTPSTGGMTGGGGSSGAYTHLQCPNTMASEVVTDQFGACDGEVKCGGGAHCIPLDRLEMRLTDALIDRMPDCSVGKCVPDDIARSGKFRFRECMAELGPGRCIPQCFAVWVMPLSVIFERGAGGCGLEEVCTPCVNPLDGQPSGACPTDMCAADGA